MGGCGRIISVITNKEKKTILKRELNLTKQRKEERKEGTMKQNGEKSHRESNRQDRSKTKTRKEKEGKMVCGLILEVHIRRK